MVYILYFDLTTQNNPFFFIDFYIIETLDILVTIVKKDNAIKACMVNKT